MTAPLEMQRWQFLRRKTGDGSPGNAAEHATCGLAISGAEIRGRPVANGVRRGTGRARRIAAEAFARGAVLTRARARTPRRQVRPERR
jgi:hypothetical protein